MTTTIATCEACHARPAGHGHFGWYCEPCAELPYGQAAPAPQGECDGCRGVHEATYSHEGRFGEGSIYAVVCPADGLTTYVTTEALR